MTEAVKGQLSIFDLDIWFGKTSPEHSQATKEKISKPSSRKSSGSQIRQHPMCLCLKRENGVSQDASTMRWGGGQLPGCSTMLSSGEFLREESGLLCLPISTDSQPHRFYLTINTTEKPTEEMPTQLSDILQSDAKEKYRLSERACRGILNRAAKRGKILPEILKQALESQISNANEIHST